ncbi:tetratricopeptide repeat protein [Thermodesulfobacteriota bacterium]
MKTKNLIIESLLLLSLIFTVFVIYSSNLDGPFIFDDSRIENNPQLHLTELTPETLLKAGFESKPKTRPVAYMSFALNYFFHGFETRGYHLVNIFIHGLTAIFLYLLLKTTLNLPLLQPKYDKYAFLPFVAALIWAVHPLQTQSVSYIIQRMNSMSALFYILSLYLYVNGRLNKKTVKKWVLFFCSFLTGLLALGSKETAATLPFFIFLYEWYFLQDLDFSWLKKQIFPALFLLCFIGVLLFGYLGKNPVEHIIVSYGGRDFTPLQRILTEFRVIFFYISLLLLPLPGRLNLDHDFTLSTTIATPFTTAVSAGLLLVLLVIAAGSARKHRLVSFCILWFLGNLVIESSVIGLEIVFEHRNYMPSMMAVVLILVLFFPIMKQNIVKVVFLCLVVLLFSVWTFERNRVWSDRISLWGDCAAKSPSKSRPHNNLGVELKRQGRPHEAIDHFRQAIAIDPQIEESYNNLGNAYMQIGRSEEAVRQYTIALDIAPKNPIIHVNLGNALAKRWQLEEALLHYGEALHLNPDYDDARQYFMATQRMIESRRLKKTGNL